MWRWMLFVLILIAGLVAVIALSPTARFMAGALMGAVLDPGPPPIAGDIRCADWRTCAPADRRFNAVLLRRFPIGSSAQGLESALLAEGFHHLEPSFANCMPHGTKPGVGVPFIECPTWDENWDPRNDLSYRWGKIPCGSAVIVRWSADRSGRLTHIEGGFDYVCL